MRGARKRAGTASQNQIQVRAYDYLDAAVSRGDMGRRTTEKRKTTPCAERERKQAPLATKNEGRSGSGCEVFTYVRNKCQVYTYMYKYISFIPLCARSKGADTVGDETKANRVEGVAAANWVRIRT